MSYQTYIKITASHTVGREMSVLFLSESMSKAKGTGEINGKPQI